ncbi:MAG: hypothetical protein F6K40_15320 [Okeania sp. SIO3I5]|uniref:hypothetical protein n=1 Tax=Okeania sp. SIO3I5 TaxID=2607805 RepID=UPI0013B8300D|nr:hypothetical protein [Okeania sp. SIO3I5]NEQ37564.1 hypothetical protein [Okeania sp. SIO3I5]
MKRQYLLIKIYQKKKEVYLNQNFLKESIEKPQNNNEKIPTIQKVEENAKELRLKSMINTETRNNFPLALDFITWNFREKAVPTNQDLPKKERSILKSKFPKGEY